MSTSTKKRLVFVVGFARIPFVDACEEFWRIPLQGKVQDEFGCYFTTRFTKRPGTAIFLTMFFPSTID